MWGLCTSTNLKNPVDFENFHLLGSDQQFMNFGIWCFLLPPCMLPQWWNSLAPPYDQSREFSITWVSRGILNLDIVHLPCHNPQLVVIILVANLDKSFNNFYFVIGLNQRKSKKEKHFFSLCGGVGGVFPESNIEFFPLPAKDGWQFSWDSSTFQWQNQPPTMSVPSRQADRNVEIIRQANQS